MSLLLLRQEQVEAPVIAAVSRGAEDHRRGAHAVIAQSSGSRLDTFQLISIPLADDTLTISHMARRTPGHGMTDEQPKRSGYAVCMHLEELRSYDIWCDDKLRANPPLASAAFHINDMRHSWRADIRSSFDVVNIYFPQSAIDELVIDVSAERPRSLKCDLQDCRSDPIMTNFALALLPALCKPHEANRLFLDHTWRAAAAHLVRAYGDASADRAPRRGGLAPWQERRAKEMLLADLAGSVTLSELASACRLSSSHFSQAFRETVGSPPHKWLLARRIDQAREMMLNTHLPLSDIALASGFADQSHFTRVFSRLNELSPAAWRRAHLR